MKQSLEAVRVAIPFLSPFTTSFGTEEGRDAFILRFTSGDITAYAECVTSVGPYYSYEDNSTAIHIIKDHLAKAISDTPSPSEFMRRVERVKGHNMAKAAAEMLLWDYHSKKDKKSLAQVIGPTKGYAEVGISIGMDKPDAMVRKVGAAVEKGYKRMKVKIEKGKEYEILKAVRDSYPEVPLSADANSDYRLADLLLLKRIDRFDLVYLEQPLEHDDLVDHAKLAKEMSTPICLDESISTVDRARQAFEIGAARVINIKPGRLGGFTNSLEVVRIARENGGHVWVGGMLETGVGRAYNVAFASLESVDYPGDTSPNEKYFARDIVKNPFKMENGRIRPNGGPGIGVELDPIAMDRFTTETIRVY